MIEVKLVTLLITEELLKRLEAMCILEDKSLSVYIEDLIEKGIPIKNTKVYDYKVGRKSGVGQNSD